MRKTYGTVPLSISSAILTLYSGGGIKPATQRFASHSFFSGSFQEPSAATPGNIRNTILTYVVKVKHVHQGKDSSSDRCSYGHWSGIREGAPKERGADFTTFYCTLMWNGLIKSKSQEFFGNLLQNVAVCDVDLRKGENAVRELQAEYGADRVIFIKTDVTNIAELEGAFKKTHTTFQALDIVINNAGILDDGRWELEIAINLNAAVRGTLLGLQYMGKDKGGKGGVVVNISSTAGLAPVAGAPVYVATKHAVIGLSRSFGLPYHFDRTGVRVLAMCPGVTDTRLISDAPRRQLRQEWGIQLGREVDTFQTQKPESVAKGMMHLIEKGSSGSIWVAEGGEPVYEIHIPDRQTLRVE
ncbi:hypothetical protein Cfor_07241 [Coptotermes formosanus]|uniref:Uncharacterized protein n=1 Tax=Coptotermes formosanus TaxID=36987 RepID=A0A6L2QE02_COPFO|nr:hypothetical protein Cfor_07241 [Coptotermes formosanus]